MIYDDDDGDDDGDDDCRMIKKHDGENNRKDLWKTYIINRKEYNVVKRTASKPVKKAYEDNSESLRNNVSRIRSFEK